MVINFQVPVPYLPWHKKTRKTPKSFAVKGTGSQHFLNPVFFKSTPPPQENVLGSSLPVPALAPDIFIWRLRLQLYLQLEGWMGQMKIKNKKTYLVQMTLKKKKN